MFASGRPGSSRPCDVSWRCGRQLLVRALLSHSVRKHADAALTLAFDTEAVTEDLAENTVSIDVFKVSTRSPLSWYRK